MVCKAKYYTGCSWLSRSLLNELKACGSHGLTIDRSKLLLMSTGKDLLVQGLCILVLALFQVAGSLERKDSG